MKKRTLIAVLLLTLTVLIMYFPYFYKKEVPVKVDKFDSTYSFKNLNRGL